MIPQVKPSHLYDGKVRFDQDLDHLRFHHFPIVHRRTQWSNLGGRCIHHWSTLPLWCFVLCEETIEETGRLRLHIGIQVTAVVQGTGSELATLWVDGFLRRLLSIESILNDRHGGVAADEVGMGGVDVAGLHAIGER